MKRGQPKIISGILEFDHRPNVAKPVAKGIIDGTDDFIEANCLVGIGGPIAVPANEFQRLYILQQNPHPYTIGPECAKARTFVLVILAPSLLHLGAAAKRDFP
jgi:hypothetical protein